jgi:uncharacterized repeat protein (TIGR03803 family)
MSLAQLLLNGGTLYGTTEVGGNRGLGALFKVNTDGSSYVVLADFDDSGGVFGGEFPVGKLVLSGETLYGTTQQGPGPNGRGTVFRVDTNGAGYREIKIFTNVNDGAFPYAGPILCNNTLYGTTVSGGNGGSGTVFRVGTNGTGYTNLVSFPALVNYTNSDGAFPKACLVMKGDTLYGTTTSGGNSGFG